MNVNFNNGSINIIQSCLNTGKLVKQKQKMKENNVSLLTTPEL